MEYNVVYANHRLTADAQNGEAEDTQGHVYNASPASTYMLTASLRHQPASHQLVRQQPNLTHQFYASPSLLQWRAGPIPEG